MLCLAEGEAKRKGERTIISGGNAVAVKKKEQYLQTYNHTHTHHFYST